MKVSCLRYVGTKDKYVPIVRQYLDKYPLLPVIEPFCGSLSFSLEYAKQLSLLKIRRKFIASDLNFDLMNLWFFIKYEPITLIAAIRKLLARFDSKVELYQYCLDYQTLDDRLLYAATYYILNRYSFKASNPEAGYSQQAFNTLITDNILNNIKNTSSLLNRYHFRLNCCDYLDIMYSFKGIYILDPPYHYYDFDPMQQFYTHQSFDHDVLCSALNEFKYPYILFYDDNDHIKQMYKDVQNIITLDDSVSVTQKRDSSSERDKQLIIVDNF